jgi:effector-binding domain-containing protein
MTTIAKSLLPLLAGALLLACNNGSSEKKGPEPPTIAPGADSSKPTGGDSAKPVAQKPPIINIIDTLAVAKTVLYMKDSAASTERIGMKLGIIYDQKLGKCLADNKLTMAGAPMAWYASQEPPFFFEAGVPVNKKPTKLPPGVFVREIPAGNVTIARFFGPYEMTGLGYQAVMDRLKASKTATTAPPYEVYIGDPGTQPDPYKVQTDIVFPVKAPEQK